MCSAALAASDIVALDDLTVSIAQAIVAEAKAMIPNDKILGAVQVQASAISWTGLQSAMETVISSIEVEDKGSSPHRPIVSVSVVNTYSGVNTDRQTRHSL